MIRQEDKDINEYLTKKLDEQNSNSFLDSVSKPLSVGSVTMYPIDDDGDIEMESGGYSSFLTTNEAKELIEYLQSQINAC